jgi:uncharacterized membrane protein YhaH (DUF805 family)
MIDALKKYADFHGRASRKEFWQFQLFYWVLSLLASYIDALLGYNLVENYNLNVVYSFGSFGYFHLVVTLALIIPLAAVSVRRFHDVNKSGWWIIAALIPFLVIFELRNVPVGEDLQIILVGVATIAGLIALNFFLSPAKSSGNRFGSKPRKASAMATRSKSKKKTGAGKKRKTKKKAKTKAKRTKSKAKKSKVKKTKSKAKAKAKAKKRSAKKARKKKR